MQIDDHFALFDTDDGGLIVLSDFRRTISSDVRLGDSAALVRCFAEIESAAQQGEWFALAADYGLRQIPIEVEGKEPKAADLARLVLWGRERGVRVIFVSPQFSRKGAAAVAAEIGATLVDLDPLAPGWMENLRRAGHLLHDAVK